LKAFDADLAGGLARTTVYQHLIQVRGVVRLGCLHYRLDNVNDGAVIYIDASEYRPCLDQTPAVPVPFGT
jgi:hypothetical protein